MIRGLSGAFLLIICSTIGVGAQSSPTGVSSAFAQRMSLGLCRQVEDNDKRLVCYDSAVDTFFKKPDAQVSGKSDSSAADDQAGWEVQIGKSKINDLPEVFLSLHPVEQGGSSIFRKGALQLRCKENVTDFIVLFTDSFPYTQERPAVTYRIDDQKAVKARWVKSTNSSAAGLWGGANSIPMIKQISQAKRFVVRQGHDQAGKVLEFRLDGLQKHVKDLRAACGW